MRSLGAGALPSLSLCVAYCVFGAQSVVCCVRFSTDGTKVAAGCHSCVKVFDVFTFRQLYVCRKVRCVRFEGVVVNVIMAVYFPWQLELEILVSLRPRC